MKSSHMLMSALVLGLSSTLCLCHQGESHSSAVNHARVAAVVAKACKCAQDCVKCPCSKPKPQKADEESCKCEQECAKNGRRSEAVEAQEETQVERAASSAEHCPNRSEVVEAKEETQAEEVAADVKACGCEQECTKCPCSKPRPGRSEAVEAQETQAEEAASSVDAERCPCNKPRPNRSEAVEVQEETHVEQAAPAVE